MQKTSKMRSTERDTRHPTSDRSSMPGSNCSSSTAAGSSCSNTPTCCRHPCIDKGTTGISRIDSMVRHDISESESAGVSIDVSSEYTVPSYPSEPYPFQPLLRLCAWPVESQVLLVDGAFLFLEFEHSCPARRSPHASRPASLAFLLSTTGVMASIVTPVITTLVANVGSISNGPLSGQTKASAGMSA